LVAKRNNRPVRNAQGGSAADWACGETLETGALWGVSLERLALIRVGLTVEQIARGADNGTGKWLAIQHNGCGCACSCAHERLLRERVSTRSQSERCGNCDDPCFDSHFFGPLVFDIYVASVATIHERPGKLKSRLVDNAAKDRSIKQICHI
jgi:hypothetical protein